MVKFAFILNRLVACGYMMAFATGLYTQFKSLIGCNILLLARERLISLLKFLVSTLIGNDRRIFYYYRCLRCDLCGTVALVS